MAENERGGTQEVSRRSFVGWAVGLGTGFVALAAGIPLVGSVVRSSGRTERAEYIQVGEVASIPVGKPFAVTFAQTARDAYNLATVPHSAYVLKKSDTDITVFSPVCPHLGCHVSFESAVNEYVCPCHGSRFAVNGHRTAGPAPRGLDTMPSKIEKGMLSVQWVQYRPGAAEKTSV
jgi:menaquinol-cytochrome c reductase iron-sulfur subunit